MPDAYDAPCPDCRGDAVVTSYKGKAELCGTCRGSGFKNLPGYAEDGWPHPPVTFVTRPRRVHVAIAHALLAENGDDPICWGYVERLDNTATFLAWFEALVR